MFIRRKKRTTRFSPMALEQRIGRREPRHQEQAPGGTLQLRDNKSIQNLPLPKAPAWQSRKRREKGPPPLKMSYGVAGQARHRKNPSEISGANAGR